MRMMLRAFEGLKEGLLEREEGGEIVPKAVNGIERTLFYFIISPSMGIGQLLYPKHLTWRMSLNSLSWIDSHDALINSTSFVCLAYLSLAGCHQSVSWKRDGLTSP